MSNETNIQGMTFLHQLVFEIQDKITGPLNICHIGIHVF